MSDAKSSTATGTTATAEAPATGRFAPSPTGPLHLGSLVAAAGSYLDARSRPHGRWLLRIEDLDFARNLPGAEQSIIAALRIFGFRHDGEVARQSARLPQYEAALARLEDAGLLFNCTCSRREISAAGLGDEPRCIADCRRRGHAPGGAALRVRLEGLQPREVRDRSGRPIRFDPRTQADVVVRRRDGVIAYQLAVVVDDAAQGITEVVRGADLLDSTPRQILLQRALGLPTPRYLHLPLVVDGEGRKRELRHFEGYACEPARLELAAAVTERCEEHRPLPYVVRDQQLWLDGHLDPAGGPEAIAIVSRAYQLAERHGAPPYTDCVLARCTARRSGGSR